MATKAKKRGEQKLPSSAATTQPTHFLTICKDCKIRLVVSKDKSSKCDLCSSPNISVEVWK